MKWGKKWGQNPVTKVHSYWGVLKNDIVQSFGIAQSAQAIITIICDTGYPIVPALGVSNDTILFYPYAYPFVTGTQQCILRNAKFGNTLSVDTGAIVRRNRSQQLQTYRDPLWPTFTTLKFSMEKLKATQITTLKSFFETYAGLQMGLQDQNNRRWKGFITTQDLDIIQTQHDDCNYDVTFSFLGVLQNP